MANINDFGEKIGGARKDLWAAYGLNLSDLDEMNAAERDKYIKKDNVWKRPDYQKMMDEGMPRRVAYFIKIVRDALPTSPNIPRSVDFEDIPHFQDKYVGFIGAVRDAAMSLKSDQDIAGFFDRNFGRYITPISPGSRYCEIDPEMRGLITDKVLSLSSMEYLPRLDREIQKKQFGFQEDEKILSNYSFFLYDNDKAKFEQDRDRLRLTVQIPGGRWYFYPKDELADPANWQVGTWFAVKRNSLFQNNITDLESFKKSIVETEKATRPAEKDRAKAAARKSKFVPPQLSHVRFSGADFRGGRNMQGRDYLEVFKFRGGEFGNWMNERDRQASLDMGYEALCAMAKALNISAEDISLGGRLAIAFGARGQGAAMAHYEPMRNVINLTKMKGAGSLAHEWGHALDDIANAERGGSLLASQRKGLLQTQVTLHQHMAYKTITRSAEEMAAEWNTKAKNRTKRAETVIRDYLPPNYRLTPEQIAERDNLIAAALSDSAIRYDVLAGVPGRPASLEALSDFCKRTTGHCITKSYLESICYQLADVNAAREKAAAPEPETRRVRTDYKQASEAFDKEYSKENQGYWADECEMFARAFACYVHDKLDAAGIRCDYLVGHAEAGPVPHGEERAQLNADFDALISEFKEKGLLHDYLDVEFHAPEKTAEAGKGSAIWDEMSFAEDSHGQLSLDDLIANAVERSSSSAGAEHENPVRER